MSCTEKGHMVGEIRNAPIRSADWEAAVAAFEGLVDDFNIRGQRDQVEHPGWCNTFKFCTECGVSLDASQARPPAWKS